MTDCEIATALRSCPDAETCAAAAARIEKMAREIEMMNSYLRIATILIRSAPIRDVPLAPFKSKVLP